MMRAPGILRAPPLALLLLLTLWARAASALTVNSYPLRFLAVGDWGRAKQTDPAGYNQTRVAGMMAKRASQAGSQPHMVISTGDNFYGFGLVSVDDPNFKIKFTDVYANKSLQVPWYSVLGNHDYGETSKCTPAETSSVLHQLNKKLRDRDPRWHAFRNKRLSFVRGKVDIFFLDTQPAKFSRYYDCFAKFPGGMQTQDWVDNLIWLRNELKASKAEWKVIIGHHGPRSSGRHQGDLVVRYALEPLIRRYNVQAFFTGHDHNLEHLHVLGNDTYTPNYHIITSGGGSRRYAQGFGRDNGAPSTRYPTSPYSKWGELTDGFVACTLGADRLTVQFYSTDHADGAVPAYTASIPRVPLVGR